MAFRGRIQMWGTVAEQENTGTPGPVFTSPYRAISFL